MTDSGERERGGAMDDEEDEDEENGD